MRLRLEARTSEGSTCDILVEWVGSRVFIFDLKRNMQHQRKTNAVDEKHKVPAHYSLATGLNRDGIVGLDVSH